VWVAYLMAFQTGIKITSYVTHALGINLMKKCAEAIRSECNEQRIADSAAQAELELAYLHRVYQEHMSQVDQKLYRVNGSELH